MKTASTASLLLLPLLAGLAASASAVEAKTWPPRLVFANGTELAATGNYAYDVNRFDGDGYGTAATALEDEEDFRRKEFGFTLKRKGFYDVTASYDFHSDTWMDVALRMETKPLFGRDAGRLRLGQFKLPVGFEGYTSTRAGSFLENSLPTQAFYESRRVGAEWAFDRPAYLWNLGYFFGNDLQGNNPGTTLAGRVAGLPYRTRVFASLLFPIFFLAAFVAPVAFCANRAVRAPLLATAAVLAASLTYLWTAPHYFAPALGLFAVAWLGVYRWLRTVKLSGRPVGLSLVRLLPLVLVFFTVKGVMDYPRRALSDNQRQGVIRRQIEDKLEALPGNHLVVVTYAPDSNVHAEWVYNRADIDHARVVWARDLGPEKNKPLFAYFKDRDRYCAHISARNIDFRDCPEPGKDAAAPRPAP